VEQQKRFPHNILEVQALQRSTEVVNAQQVTFARWEQQILFVAHQVLHPTAEADVVTIPPYLRLTIALQKVLLQLLLELDITLLASEIHINQQRVVIKKKNVNHHSIAPEVGP
jgi:hypothetical protein